MGVVDMMAKLVHMVNKPEAMQQQLINNIINMLQHDDAQNLPEEALQSLNRDIKALFTQNGDPAAKILGLKVLMALIDVDYSEFPMKVTFFCNLTKSCLPSPDIAVIRRGAECMAKLVREGMARDGGLNTALYIVEEELRRAVDLLSADWVKMDLNRWLSACFIISELATSVPELIPHRCDPSFFERIWNPLWCESLMVREAAVKCFKAVAAAFKDEPDWSTGLLAKVIEGMEKGDEHAAHGSFLILKELLPYISKDLTDDKYRNLVNKVLRVGSEAENAHLRTVSVDILPMLAREHEDLFGCRYLADTMQRIGLYYKRGDDKSVPFQALSELCSILSKTYLNQHRKTILNYISVGMDVRGDIPLRTHAVRCLGLMCGLFEADMGEMGLWLEKLSHGPIVETHFETSLVIARHFPNYRTRVMEMNATLAESLLSANHQRDHVCLALRLLGSDEAWETMDRKVLLNLLEKAILSFVHDEHHTVREASIRGGMLLIRHFASSKVKTLDMQTIQAEVPTVYLQSLLAKIIDQGVVDMVPSVRRLVFTLLEENTEFDHLMVECDEVIECLFMSYNDVDPDIQRSALILLCRLSSLKAVPGLTRILNQLNEDLGSTRYGAKYQCHCSDLLFLVIKYIPTGVLALSNDLLATIKDRLQDHTSSRNPQLVASLLNVLDGLINTDDTIPKATLLEFLPLVLNCLEDRLHPNKRLSAVLVLIRIIRSSGLVMDFYEEYPHVLPILLNILQNKEDWNLQSAVMKLIGTIGAVDPVRAKNVTFLTDFEEQDFAGRGGTVSSQIKGLARSKSDTEPAKPAELMRASLKQQQQQVANWSWALAKDASAALQLPMRAHPSLSEQLPTVALQFLLSILANPTHANKHPKAIDAIRQVIKSLSLTQLEKFCKHLLSPILGLLRKSSVRDSHSKLFQMVITIVVNLANAMEPHCEGVITLLREYWEQVLSEASGKELGLEGASEDKTEPMMVENLLINLITLLEEVSKVHSHQTMVDHSKWIIHDLAQTMTIDNTDRMELTQKCFDAFRSLAVFMEDLMHIVIPVLLDPICRTDAPFHLKDKALSTLTAIVDTVNIKDHTARVLHPLLRVLREQAELFTTRRTKQEKQFHEAVMNCLATLITGVGTAFVRFIPLTVSHLNSIGITEDTHRDIHRLLSELKKNGTLPKNSRSPRQQRSQPRTVIDRPPRDAPKVFSCLLGMHVADFNPSAFKRIIATHMKILPSNIDVLRTKSPACTVYFRFADADAVTLANYSQRFMQMVKQLGVQQSALARDLRLVEVTEKSGAIQFSPQSLRQYWNVNMQSRTKRKSRDWEEWMNRFSLELLKHAPSQALQACSQVAQAYMPLARDLFPFAFVCCFQELEETDKKDLLSNLNTALKAENLPPIVLHMILSLAEFMEEERYISVYTTQGRTKVFKVTRESTTAKFGIGYADGKQEGATRVQVSKVQAGLPGEKAGVPSGARVLMLNGTKVKNVKHLSELLQNQTTITLEVQLPNTSLQRIDSKPNPFFDIDILIGVCERKQLLAKALHYKEERFREKVTELKQNADANPKFEDFIDQAASLIQTSNNLGLKEAANGLLDYTKMYFEEMIPAVHGSDTSADALSQVDGKLKNMLLEGQGYEKLQWWSQAIRVYKGQAEKDSKQCNKYLVGIMRCYKQLGRWEHLLYEAKRVWDRFDQREKQDIAGLAAHAAWILSAWSTLGDAPTTHWDFMETAVSHMPREGEGESEREFLLAVLAVHGNDFNKAERHITSTRRLLEGRLSSLVGESYARAYSIIVWLQKVNGLEEVIEFKKSDSFAKRQLLKEMWHKRMYGMQPTVEYWQDMLAMQSLVNTDGGKIELDADDMDLWLKFTSICRRCNRNSFAESTLFSLMRLSVRNFRNYLTDENIDQHVSTHFPSVSELIENGVAGPVCLSYFKHLYHCDMRSRACDDLRTYIKEATVLREKLRALSTELEDLEDTAAKERSKWIEPKARQVSDPGKDLGSSIPQSSPESLAGVDPNLVGKIMKLRHEASEVEQQLSDMDLTDDELLAKMHNCLGEWYQELHKDNFWEAPHRGEVLRHFGEAIRLAKESSRAWHSWGLQNYRIAFRATSLHEPEKEEPLSGEERDKRMVEYLVEALRGFFNSLAFLEDESFCVPNLLRILTVWFRYGDHDKIESELLRGRRSIRVSIWLYVLPQLVGRVSFPNPRVRQQVHDLLTFLGSDFPHHVVYPLTVSAVHGNTSSRRRCTQEILDQLAYGDKGNIFMQARMVSQEIIRVTISWAEYFYTGIEEAAKLHQEGEKSIGAMKKLLLDLYHMLETPETKAEKQFLQDFQNELEQAKRYLISDRISHAWSKYLKIYENLQGNIQQTKELLLEDVAPELCNTEGFEVAVPGINNPEDKPVLIQKFGNKVRVIQSKQKPKVIVIIGDDGNEYKFLCKGHEDMRQDERVMQLFGLINALFKRTDDLYHLHLIRCPVVPLSNNVGLIGWLEQTQTIYHMISSYRKERGIPVNLECAFLCSRADLKNLNEFYHLDDRKKQEVLAECIEKTPSDCLKRVFWSVTATSELWLEYRTTYVRTLAAMSMVGYILGLGDRHLNNIMLTNEGHIVHIDFGDCFEVALNRQRHPEKVPFRLTRLLVHAMEASGYEGTFRYTCENVMRCLRKNRDSLTSLLETFVYDPLINWKLLETVAPEEAEAVAEGQKDTTDADPTPEGDDDRKPEEITTAVEVHRIPAGEAENSPCSADRDDDEVKAKEAGVEEMNVRYDELPSGETSNLDAEAEASAYTGAVIMKTLQDGDMSAPRSVVVKSMRNDSKEINEKALEGELVNEKAKQVVIRIREKLTGYDFHRPATRSPLSQVLNSTEAGRAHQISDGTRMLIGFRTTGDGFGSYEGSYIKTLNDDYADGMGESVLNTISWWPNSAPAPNPNGSEDGQRLERCTVPEQVDHLIRQATSVENLCQMFIGWCPFW